MTTGWGFIRTPLNAEGFGFIAEVMRDGQPFRRQSRDLFFRQEDCLVDTPALGPGQFVRYRVTAGAKGDRALQVEPLQQEPPEFHASAELAVLYAVPEPERYGFAATATGAVHLHITRVIGPVRELQAPRLFRVIIDKAIPDPGKAPSVLVAIPVEQVTAEEVSSLLRIPRPKQAKSQEGWSATLLELALTMSPTGQRETTLETALQACYTLPPATLYERLPVAWRDPAAAPPEFRHWLRHYAGKTYSDYWLTATLVSAAGPVPEPFRPIFAQAIPHSDLKWHLNNCPADEAGRWHALAGRLGEADGGAETAALIETTLHDRAERERQESERRAQEGAQQRGATDLGARIAAVLAARAVRADGPPRPPHPPAPIPLPERRPSLTPPSSDRASHPQRAGILPARLRPDVPDAAAVREFVQERSIERLVHVTTSDNLPKICQEGVIYSRKELEERGLDFAPFDRERYDRRLDLVNCSVTLHNFYTFYRHQAEGVPYVLLHIIPDYLWKEGTEVCAINAASSIAQILPVSSSAVRSLFAPTVYDQKGQPHTRDGKPANIPTCIQAEVMILRGIPLEDLIEIVVRSPYDTQRVRQSGWGGPVRECREEFDYERNKKWLPANATTGGRSGSPATGWREDEWIDDCGATLSSEEAGP